MKNIGLAKAAVQIIGISFPYNKAIQNNFRTTLKLWSVRRLLLEEKIKVFKSLAISKIVYLSLLTSVPSNTAGELIKNQNIFYGTSQLLKSSIQQLVWITEIAG